MSVRAHIYTGMWTLSSRCATQLSAQPYVADEALSNLSDRHKMSQTARGVHTDTDAHIHTHTPCVKCSSNRCAQLRIMPSGQIYVFRDEQVAVEDKAKASE